MKERIIVDHQHRVSGVANVGMTKELLRTSGCARQTYHVYFDEEKEKREQTQQTRKWKVVQEEVDQIMMKRRKLQTNINALLTSADELAVKAEATEQISVLQNQMPTGKLQKIKNKI